MLKMLLICIILLSQVALSKEADSYVEKLREKGYLKLSDGKEIIISYPLSINEGQGEKVRIFLRKGTKVLWDKTYSYDLGTVWHEAYFIPIKKDQFVLDLNNDTWPEIAVAVWSGGNATDKSSAFIFSVGTDSLNLLKKETIAIEFAKSVYE